jgi:hypothetical protein
LKNDRTLEGELEFHVSGFQDSKVFAAGPSSGGFGFREFLLEKTSGQIVLTHPVGLEPELMLVFDLNPSDDV